MSILRTWCKKNNKSLSEGCELAITKALGDEKIMLTEEKKKLLVRLAEIDATVKK